MMTTEQAEQRQREKGIISRIKQGILPTPEEAMDVLRYEKVTVGEQTGVSYTGKALGLQMLMGVRMMLQEAVWWSEGGSGSLSHSGKVNMGNIATTYFNIASRERQKQAILVWGCGISLTYWLMENQVVTDPKKRKEVDAWWEAYDDENQATWLHPPLSPSDCYPPGFNCLPDYHIVDGVLKDNRR